MIRTLLVLTLIGIPLWSPWMDTGGTEHITSTVFTAFGAMPYSCYDVDGTLIQEGVQVRWYPFGRMVNTCGKSFIVWTWGGVTESGGVSKRAEEIRTVQSRPLTCNEVLKRQEVRRATSTDNRLTLHTGERAIEPNFAIFPEAKSNARDIKQALEGGATFAGKFAVASFECGATCQTHTIIDVGSGLIVAHDIKSEYGVDFSLNSATFVTNPVKNLPPLPEQDFEAETMGLSIARISRDYYQLTTDSLTGSHYLVRICVESSATGYIEIVDDRMGLIAPAP